MLDRAISTQKLFRQRPHNTFKRQQRHCVRREGPQEAGQKSPPVPLGAALPVHGHGGVPPPGEPLDAIIQPTAQRIRHDALLDHIARVARQPKHLSTQPARPEVDRWRAHLRVLLHPPRKDVICSPPAKEETPEQQRRAQAVIHTPDSVMPIDLGQRIDRPAVQALRLVGRVLDLQPRFDVLHGRRDEAHGRAGHDAR